MILSLKEWLVKTFGSTEVLPIPNSYEQWQKINYSIMEKKIAALNYPALIWLSPKDYDELKQCFHYSTSYSWDKEGPFLMIGATVIRPKYPDDRPEEVDLTDWENPK